jgi:hypothetical protein
MRACQPAAVGRVLLKKPGLVLSPKRRPSRKRGQGSGVLAAETRLTGGLCSDAAGLRGAPNTGGSAGLFFDFPDFVWRPASKRRTGGCAALIPPTQAGLRSAATRRDAILASETNTYASEFCENHPPGAAAAGRAWRQSGTRIPWSLPPSLKRGTRPAAAPGANGRRPASNKRSRGTFCRVLAGRGRLRDIECMRDPPARGQR